MRPMLILGTLAVLLPTTAQEGAKEGTPRPTLPPVKRVTLKLDKTRFGEAERKFSEACGFAIRHESMGMMGGIGACEGDEDQGRDPVTISLDNLTLVEAVHRFGDVAGIHYDCADGELVTPAWGHVHPNLGRSFHDHFGFEVHRIDESISDDFSQESRTCTLVLQMTWQPDVSVYRYVALTVHEAKDNLGHDLRLAEPATGDLSYWINCTIGLAPKEATSLARVRGTLEIEVPGDVVDVVIDDLRKERAGPLCIGGFKVEISAPPRDSPTWTVAVEPEKPGAAWIGIAELRLNPMRSRSFSFANGRQAFYINDDAASPVTSISFKIVKTKARLSVPFDFADIPLMRTK